MVFLNAVYHESSWISPTFRCSPWSQQLHIGVVDELLRVGHGELHQPHGREDAAERRRQAQTHAQTNAHGHAKADTWRFPDVKGVWVVFNVSMAILLYVKLLNCKVRAHVLLSRIML